ncbi:MAG: hypothetical protein II768_11545, partial [Clostridia bacterium]|nr:hypothetical protein [Clostridia bacterium]
LFQKVVGCRGNALTRTPQSPEPPRLPKEFLFLLLFLLDKGEKEERNDLNYRRAVAFSPFLKFMRQLPAGDAECISGHAKSKI